MISNPPAVAYPSITQTDGFGDWKMASQIRAERAAISYAVVVPMKSPWSSSRSNPEQNVPLAAADHHDPDVVVLLGALPRLVQLLQELLADRVALVRAVQPDTRDVTVDLVLDRIGFDGTRHDAPSRLC